MLRWRDRTIKERRVRGGRRAAKGMIANACPTHVVDGAIAGKYDRYGEPARRGKFQDPVLPQERHWPAAASRGPLLYPHLIRSGDPLFGVKDGHTYLNYVFTQDDHRTRHGSLASDSTRNQLLTPPGPSLIPHRKQIASETQTEEYLLVHSREVLAIGYR